MSSVREHTYRDSFDGASIPPFEIPVLSSTPDPAPMYPRSHRALPPTDAQLASTALDEEAAYRFPSFNANDAVTLGLSLRKRFRGSSRHQKQGKGLLITVQTIAGHTLFSCTVGDLGAPATLGNPEVSLDSWQILEGMVAVVRKTGHSSYYVEKGMGAIGKTPKQVGVGSEFRVFGGAFPIWLENAPCCPIGVVACYSGSSSDDHHLVVSSCRDYLHKMADKAGPPPRSAGTIPPSTPGPPLDNSSEWRSSAAGKLYRPRGFEDDDRELHYEHEDEHDH